MELLLSQLESHIDDYMSMPAIRALYLTDGQGNVDLDRVHDVAVKRFGPMDKLTVNLPVIGCFTFHRSDVDNLCDLIRRA